MPARENMVGVWRLVSFETETEDGDTDRPFGDAPLGRLVYTAGGIMSAHLGRGDRPAFADLGEDNGARALGAMKTHFSYAGRWRLEGDRVVHEVDMSISPDWVGTEKTRRVAFDGPDLILTDEALEPRLGRKAGVGRLRWRREE